MERGEISVGGALGTSGKQHTYRGAGKQALRALCELVSVCYIEFIPVHSAPGPGAQLRRYDRLACLRSPVAPNYLPGIRLLPSVRGEISYRRRVHHSREIDSAPSLRVIGSHRRTEDTSFDKIGAGRANTEASPEVLRSLRAPMVEGRCDGRRQ